MLVYLSMYLICYVVVHLSYSMDSQGTMLDGVSQAVKPPEVPRRSLGSRADFGTGRLSRAKVQPGAWTLFLNSGVG